MSGGARVRRLAALGALAGLVVLLGLALWKTGGRDRLEVVTGHPVGIMGTSCQLVAIAPAGQREVARRAVTAAEATLRRLEALMSTWIDASEVSRLNRAPAGEVVPLSPDVLTVLRAARAAWEETDGAFDATCRPLIELWRRAGREGVLPDPAEIARARSASRWEDFELLEHGAVKRRDSARIDLGGIAKGYAIDRALDAMREEGAVGGLVDVGGDLHVFGRTPGDAGFEVVVRHPRGEGAWRTIRLAGDRAICTSGDYARWVEIGGRRYGHVIDPRTGRPAEQAASVSVLAGDAMTADIWATTLTVLGDDGLALLPEGLEALVLHPGPSDPERIVEVRSEGFP